MKAAEPARREPEAPAIEARGLTRRFGPRLALDAIDLRIPRGETFGLLGGNGAGKTTFIRLVTGFLLPSAGRVEVDGVSPSLHPSTVQRGIGFVMETARLYPELRVRGFLRFAAGARGLREPERGRAVERALERFGLAAVAGRLIGHLSKGFQQRVSLAQALVHEPSLVIVDEPTGGLDPAQRQQVQELLAGLGGGRTLLLCTHDLHEARALASRVAVLGEGRLLACGPTDEVLAEGRSVELFGGPTRGPERPS